MSRTRLPILAIAVVVAAVVAVVVATSGATTKTNSPSVAAGSAISLKQTSVGQTLVDANGRTLYLFEGDKRNVSTLSVPGQAVWPPFTATIKPQALNGAVAGRIATVAHADGSAQITYGGHPLYYYIGDRSPGQTRGQGLNQFGALWYVVAAGGSAITSAPSSPAPAASGSGAPSYGY
jgi:predicted lipoprotein with Yx(FWY)xxD motif